jgi:hypothetical protein
MDMSPNSELDHQARLEIFTEWYGDSFDAGTTLHDLVAGAGDFLASVVGQESADVAMGALVDHSLGAREGTEGWPWKRRLMQHRSDVYAEWKTGARLHQLTGYAQYGIWAYEDAPQREWASLIEKNLKDAQDLLAKAPLQQWGIERSDLAFVVGQATARWALDNGDPIEPAALATFGGVSEARIRNLMSGAGRTFSAVDGLIPAEQASRWLKERPEFYNSIWRETPVPHYGASVDAPFTNVLFVPVARDGTPFHPGLNRGAGYTVGAKGEEVGYATFPEAMSALQRMATPQWRRPNPAGNWGIVSGVRWERIEAADLDRLASSKNPRLADSQRI